MRLLLRTFVLGGLFVAMSGCQELSVTAQESQHDSSPTEQPLALSQNEASQFSPLSDPENRGGWVLVNAMSDEFNQDQLDTRKWWVEGTGGTYKKWSGRQPAQYNPDNVRVEEGRLKIGARWTPDFEFLDDPDKDGQNYENMTTGCVINFNKFRYGYLETKAKPGLASVTGAFWMTGGGRELDIFELMGAPKNKDKQHIRKRWRSNIINWEGKRKPVFREYFEIPWEVGEDFHVYGCQWTPEGIEWWGDGKLIHEVSKEEMGEDWVLDADMILWIDSEPFHWQGLPVESDLPVDFELEYVRVWQKSEHIKNEANKAAATAK
jgi:beta-glucanase (GH16 family)